MYSSAKRIYTEINRINIENTKNPNSKKFIIDKTPFNNNDDSESPTIVQNNQSQYYIVLGRILPTSNLYNQNAFEIQLNIPIDYPFKPPEVQVLTPIYHPNIGPDGKICIPLLRLTENWKSTNTLIDVINAIVNHIDHPNIDEAYSSDIANEYVKNRTEFDRKVVETIERNKISRQ